MALVILAIGFLMVLFDRKLARNAIEEARRLRTFADAAVEGLVVIDGERIVDANRSFLRLAGYDSRRRPARAACRPADRANLRRSSPAGPTPRRSNAG